MSENSLIEWTDATWNCLLGCSLKSEGCVNCYAINTAWRLQHNPNPKIAAAYAGLVKQLPSGKLTWTGKINLVEDRLADPLRWRRPRRIFVNSQSDAFHESVPDEYIDRMFAIMALAAEHTFQILTKRPDRMRVYMNAIDGERVASAIDRCDIDTSPHCAAGAIEDRLSKGPLPNVWLGTSVEHQKAADERIPELLATPAAVRFLSCEPLLGPVDLARWLDILELEFNRLDWVIVGGESGPDARPMHPNWARVLRDQCNVAGVPFFFKQWGEWREFRKGDDPFQRSELTDLGTNTLTALIRPGKKAAGRELDGREWNEVPK